MSRRHKLGEVAAGVIVLLLVCTSAAAATQWRWGRSEISITGEVVILPGLSACNVTLRGTLATEPFSTRGPVTRIGSITGAEVRGCTGAVMRFLVERGRPWSLTYDSTQGPLPDQVTSMRVWMEEATFLFERLSGANCLYTARMGASLGAEYVRGTHWEYSQPSATMSAGEQTYRSIVTLSGTCPTRPDLGMLARGTEARLSLSGIVASPSPVDFRRVEPEALTRRSVSVTVAAESTIRAIRVRNGNYFAITDPSRCVGTTLGAGASCSFNVLFAAPGEAGRAVEDAVLIETTRESLEDAVRGTT